MAASGSLVFDLEIQDEDETLPRNPGGDAAITEHIANLAAPQTIFEARLLSDVQQFKAAVFEEEGRSDIVVLATKLAAIGYQVAIRTALGGGTGQECFRNLHHEFLVIAPDSDDLLVEPLFREQFCISSATREYTKLVSALPEEWVGSRHRIKPLVKLLCQQMALAFDSAQAACPPWRQQKSIISKWLPAKKQDRGISLALPFSACSPTSPLESASSCPSQLKPYSTPQRSVSNTWHIPSAMQHTLQQMSQQRMGASPDDTSMHKAVSLQPLTRTQGFEVRQIARSVSDPGTRSARAMAAHSSAPLQQQQQQLTSQRKPSAALADQQPSMSRMPGIKPGPLPSQPALVLQHTASQQHVRQPSLPKLAQHAASIWQPAVPASKGSSILPAAKAGEQSVNATVPDLSSARQASFMAKSRKETWQQPRIHVVKLGHATPALAH